MSSTAMRAAASGTPLPRGPHKLSREEVLASQRERVVRAMLERVAEQGYPATSVSDVVSTARVSRNAFYELFRDKEDCFLAACDEKWRTLLGTLYAEAAASTWREALSAGIAAYLQFWQRDPRFAHAYLVELPAAGRMAMEHRDRAHREATRLFDALGDLARRQERDLPPLPPLATRMLAAGITEVVAQEVRAGRLDRLDRLERDLSEQAIAVLRSDVVAPTP